MKIAVVGSGISGLGVAYALSEKYDVKLFEKNQSFGGHSNTFDIKIGNVEIPVDTGFIVYNIENYPNLSSLFSNLEVATKWSDMSFGFSSANGRLEYSGSSLDSLFAQRKNLLNLKFINGLRDILRFNREAPIAMDNGNLIGLTLGEFLSKYKFRDWFKENFILPMGGAIWSMPQSGILNFPAINFVSFFRNHGLLSGLSQAPQWRTVDGGSKVYVSKLIKKLGTNAIRSCPVTSIRKITNGVSLEFKSGQSEKFDQVVICSNAPQAMKLLTANMGEELSVLSKFRTSKNRVILHSDKELMPKRSKAWSSWNFISSGNSGDLDKGSSVTYWMNKLQKIDTKTPMFVSLNPLFEPKENKIYAEFDYEHPIFDKETFGAQKEIDRVQGKDGIWFAGAWLGYGFHEDGLTAGLRVANALGVVPDWARHIPPGLPNISLLKAAE